jgi:predicted dehydrogenase
MDGEIELVAGAFSSDARKSAEQGTALYLDPGRIYESFDHMAEAEASLPEGERIDFVSIVTPNHLHFDVARAFLVAGFHVVCDKPLTNTVADAEALCRLVGERGAIFALTHNYTGYPMVKEARALVRDGRLGEIRKVVVEYPQGWLASLLEATGHKQAEWRMDPERAGVSSALADIGSHAHNLVAYVTGLEVEELCADVSSLVPGRRLEDDANLLVHYGGGARGVLYASQVSVGEENDLRLRVYGTDAALDWRQEAPGYLLLKYPDRPSERLSRGNAYLSAEARHATRLPPGHPEGFLEAFANIYLSAARCMAASIAGEIPDPLDTDYPTVQDGARGVHFIHRAIESGRTKSWVDAVYTPPED